MKAKSYAALSVVLSTLLMCAVDGIWQPPYLYKSMIKIGLFLLLPMGYFLLYKENGGRLKKLFSFKVRDGLIAFGLGVGVFAAVMGAYFLLGDYIDLSGIRDSLTAGAGVSAENFLYVALYISFVNSLLEEFFFRGFAFLTLKKEMGRRFAYLFSSAAFALYHVGMTGGWFNIWIYLLSMAGLFVGGCIFNFLNERSESIYPSWIVHMFANFAINTVGFILFGIL